MWSVEGMLPILGWRLHYGDGSTFSHEDGEWDAAPSENVQVLEYFHEAPYRTLTHGVDEYRLTPEHSAKFGKWMTDADFEALIAAVLGA